jgi:hypothetical protein
MVGVSGYPNYMLFAIDGEPPDLDGLLDLPERKGRELVRLRDLAEQVGRSARPVELTVGGGDGPVLTDDRCPVERLTDETVRRESRAVLGE